MSKITRIMLLAGLWLAATAQAAELTLGGWSNGTPAGSALTVAANNSSFATRSLASAYRGSELFVSASFGVGATSRLAANDFVSLWLDNTANGAHTAVPNFGIKSDIANGNDVFVRSTGTSGAAVAGSNLLAGQSFTLLARVYKSVATGNFDRIQLWFNPDVSDSLTTADASFSGKSGISSISLIGVRSANLDAGDVVSIDNLKMATSWSDVAVSPLPVPEPSESAMVFAGLAMMGFIARRRLSA